MTAHQSHASSILGDLNGARILCMGPDVWELTCDLAPSMGTAGWLLGVDNSAETIHVARRRGSPTNGSGPKVEFHEIDTDLRTSREDADALIQENAPSNLVSFRKLEHQLAKLRSERPLVADDSVDLVVASGLRNLESSAARALLLKEFHRVVRRGGRLMVLDVVSDETLSREKLSRVPDESSVEVGRSIMRDAELMDSLTQAGFYGITMLRRDPLPWKTVEQVELRRVAVMAHKGKEGPCWEHFQAVMYRGPFKTVEDDDGHTYPRGQQTAVCKKTFEILSREPYRGEFEYTDPLVPIPASMQKPFPCNLTNPIRDPQHLKFRMAAVLQSQSHADSKEVTAAPLVPAEEKAAVPGKSRKQVLVFERSTPERLALLREATDNLTRQVGDDLEIRIADPEGNPEVTVPAQLRFRLSLSGDECLPAIVVDGVLVSVGKVPEQEELRKLVDRGRPFGTLPFANLKSLAARVGDCCGGDSCC